MYYKLEKIQIWWKFLYKVILIEKIFIYSAREIRQGRHSAMQGDALLFFWSQLWIQQFFSLIMFILKNNKIGRVTFQKKVTQKLTQFTYVSFFIPLGNVFSF